MTQTTTGPEPRYAKALYELAVEQKNVSKIAANAQAFREVISSSDELQSTLKNALVKRTDKEAILETLLKSAKVEKVFHDFVCLMARKGRSGLIVNTLNWFERIKNEEEGIVNAVVTSATKLTATQEKEIEKFVKAQSSDAQKVNLETQVDESLKAGFKVTVGSDEFDASLLGRMNAMKQAMKQAL